jgi:hypothetical protein
MGGESVSAPQHIALRIGSIEFSARRVPASSGWPPRRTIAWLALILLLSAALGIRGLDWGPSVAPDALRAVHAEDRVPAAVISGRRCIRISTIPRTV